MELLTLKPDRNLLDANFECYRLSLDPLPVLIQTNDGGVEEVHLGDDQYGYLHAQHFGQINHLVSDPYANECVFFVNKNRCITWTRLSQDGRFSPQRCVWKIPQSEMPGNLANCSVSFAQSEWAVVCNGSNELFLLNTPSRSEGEPWQQCHTHKLEDSEVSYPAKVLHSSFKAFPSYHQFECIISHISKIDDYPMFKNQFQNTRSHFVCVLEWLTFSCALGRETSSGWFMKRHRRFIGFSAPLYAYFEALTGMLITIAEKPFKIVYDSEKQVATPNEETEKSSSDNEQLQPLYFFVQTKEDICVTFKVESDQKSDISVQIKPSNLKVKVRNKTVIEGPLTHTVDVASSTWTVANNRLEVFLTKTSEVWWKQLFLNGDDKGQEVMDPALVEEVQQRLAHLTSESEVTDVNRMPAAYDPQQLEDCDLSSYEDLILQRFDGENHLITHQVNMGGYQWLFETVATNESLPPFCTRYDVDGIVWQPNTMSRENEAEKFQVDHVATHPALGYVLASKQDRKYVTSAPDFSFAVVCDSNRHVYIYCQPESLDSSSLRNRKTGREVDRIAKQKVISLDQCDCILGLCVNNRTVFILARNSLYAIKVREDN